MRIDASTRGRASGNAPCLHLRGGPHPFPSSLLPSPGMLLTHLELSHFLFQPVDAHAPLAGSPSASFPLPFILCLPLCLLLTHFVLTRCRQGTPNKASDSQLGIRTNTRHQYRTCAWLASGGSCPALGHEGALPVAGSSFLRVVTPYHFFPTQWPTPALFLCGGP